MVLIYKIVKCCLKHRPKIEKKEEECGGCSGCGGCAGFPAECAIIIVIISAVIGLFLSTFYIISELVERRTIQQNVQLKYIGKY